jgi:hypothetical protein
MFCVMGNPRSGSTALGEAIAVSTGKKQIIEPFNPSSHRWDDTFDEDDTLWHRLDKVKESSAGFFKTVTHYEDYTLKDSEYLINSCIYYCPMLFLVRDYTFDCTLSSMIAQYTGGWNIGLISQNYRKIVSELTIDVADFRSQYEYTSMMITQYKKIVKSNINLFNRRIYYEDLFEGEITDQTFRQIEAVTGPLDKRKFIEELGRHKINGPEILKSVKNYDDLTLDRKSVV